MTRMGAALRFYCLHGLDVDALCELSEKPEEVSVEDWDKLNAVVARASEQVRVWLEAGRARALAVLAEHAKPGSKNRKVQNDWFAWAQLRPLKTPEDAKTLYVGVSIGTTPALLGTLPRGTMYYAAYLATAGGASARADLCRRMREAGMTDVFEADAAFGDDSIILGLVPLKPESSLEDVVAWSAERFRDLADRWPKIFPR